RRFGGRGDAPPAGEQRADPDSGTDLRGADRRRRAVRRRHRAPDAGENHVLSWTRGRRVAGPPSTVSKAGEGMKQSPWLALAASVVAAGPVLAQEGQASGPLVVHGGASGTARAGCRRSFS